MICLANPPKSDCQANATCTVTPVAPLDPACPCCSHDPPKFFSVFIGGVQIGLVDAECFAALCKKLGVKRPPQPEGS